MGCQASAAMLVHCVTTLCWFLRWVLDEDERRAYREFWAAWVEHDDVLNMGDPGGPSFRRFKAAKRAMQRRGL